MKLEDMILAATTRGDTATACALAELVGHRALVGMVSPHDSERIRLDSQLAVRGTTETLHPGKHLFVVPGLAKYIVLHVSPGCYLAGRVRPTVAVPQVPYHFI